MTLMRVGLPVVLFSPGKGPFARAWNVGTSFPIVPAARRGGAGNR